MNALRNYGHLLLNVAGLLACLVMAEVLIYHHDGRIDLTPQRMYTLSPHTKQILDGLKQDVKVTAFVRREDPRNAYLNDLLLRMSEEQPKLTYRVVDLNRNPSLARQYHADAYGSVVVECGARKKSFSNIREEILAAALLQVTRNYEKTVYFVTGHGERDVENADRNRGFSTAKNVLEQEFYHVKPLSLLGADGVPADATTIVVAGPRKDYLPEELERLDAYLRKGGSALFLLDPGDSGSVIAFLRRYRLSLPDEVVADADYRLAASEAFTARIPEREKESPVTSLLDSDPVFSFTRPLVALPPEAGDADEAMRSLLKSSKKSWAVPTKNGQVPEDVAYDPKRDERGPFSLGMEIALPPASKETPRTETGGELREDASPPVFGRMIVYGDSDFASNFFIDLLGNRDLLVNSVNALALEQSLIGVRPVRKQAGREQFFVSSRQGYMAFLLGTVVEPGIFLLMGVAVFAWRRMR